MEGVWGNIIDSTLRDGEQAPGVVFTLDEKLRIAAMLESCGIKELEVGTPAMGEDEVRVIREIVQAGFLMKSGFVPEHSSISSMYRELKMNHNAPESFHSEVRLMNRFMNFCSLEVTPVLIPTDSEIFRMIIFASALKTWVETCLDAGPKTSLLAAPFHQP